jgi:hypothetical protein
VPYALECLGTIYWHHVTAFRKTPCGNHEPVRRQLALGLGQLAVGQLDLDAIVAITVLAKGAVADHADLGVATELGK